MNIYKINEKSYRIRAMIDGTRVSINVDHRPTQKEARKLIDNKYAELSKRLVGNSADSFGALASRFITEKETELSPSTIRGYVSIVRNLPDRLANCPASSVNEQLIQECIDDYARNHSPKSTRNLYGLICSVLHFNGSRAKLSIELPKLLKRAEYEPTTEDIKRILAESVGSEYEIMLRLCVLGLRHGEVLALTPADLDDNNVLTINKDKVTDKDGNVLIKDKPKTEESNRRILIPSSLADLIRANGYVYRMYPNSVNKYLNRLQDRLNIPHFRLHMLRHFAAAYLHSEGFTDSQILAYGGWAENSDTMKRVYRYNLNPHESQKDISKSFDKL